MQVAHVAEPDSHVIIGGGKARAFQVQASAAAFKIMSDSLYRDKERAVAREVVCNAIDAHAMVGKEDVPVRVTLTDDELIVEDEGPGIHDDKIADIYCTLFASTKENQLNQTGGFGLGSKAPFAVSDHFTVISKHAGVMTLYAMHVGDPTTNGTPGAKIMMQVPCGNDTGLTVSVPLGAKQKAKIQTALEQIVREGGMNVVLNGEKMPANDYGELRKHGFGMTKVDRWGTSKVQVLYANVLYPVDGNAELVPYLQKLQQFTFNNYQIVLYAPPSSISVAPSRESLSYNEQTLGTLKKVLARLVGRIQGEARRMIKAELKALYKDVKRDEVPRNLHAIRQDKEDVANGAEGIARRYAQHFIAGGSYNERDIARTLIGLGRDRKRGLRLIASKKVAHSFTDDRNRYVWRRLARIVTAGDAFPFLYERLRADGALTSLSKPTVDRTWRHYRSSTIKPHITISTARDLIKKSGTGFFIVGARLKQAQIDAVRAKAEKLGFTVTVVEREKPKVEVKKEQFGPPCPPRWRNLSLTGNDRENFYDSTKTHSGVLSACGKLSFEPPAAFMGLKGTTIMGDAGFTHAVVPNPYIALRLIKQTIGRTVMIHSRGDLDALLATNVRRLEEMILDKLKVRVAKKKPYEAFYAQLALAASQDEERIGRTKIKVSSIAREMFCHSRRFAHAAVREPFKPSADRDEAWTYWLLARTVFHDRWATGTHIDKAEGEIIEKLVTEYRELAMSLEARQSGAQPVWDRIEHLELFQPFKGGHFGMFTEVQREDFLDFAEQLGRRYTARKEKTDVQ